jgi:hypothetical protein
MNVLHYIEQSPCTNCIKLAWGGYGPGRTWKIDVSIRHPLLSLNHTIFDVRGITIFNGSFQFPMSGLSMPDRNFGDGELMNADGYTTLYNPTTAGHGTEGYLEGKVATDTTPNATLNGFKRFVSDKPGNARNAFWPQDTVVVTFQIREPSPLVFGYAVDANWEPPITKPVVDPMTDFSLSANCPEAWQISVSQEPVGDGLTDSGGSTILTIDVYDWQGKDDAHPVVVECPGLFDGQMNPTWKQDGAGFTTYEVTVENSKVASQGQYRCLISKEAAENDSSDPWLDLTAYQVLELDVMGENYWARTWGGADYDWGRSVAVDTSGSTYVTGYFMGTVDFDPAAAGVDDHTSNGNPDIFLSKFDSSGIFQWARTWGGTLSQFGYGVAVDGSGNVYVTGSYRGTVDFDPDAAGVDEHTSNGGDDIFLSKFDTSGDFQWAYTWSGTGWNESGNCVAVDVAGNVHVTGVFTGTADFDPGSGVDSHTSNGSTDIFITRFDASGDFQWARTWGGMAWQYGYGVDVDSSGNAYVAGTFYDVVDFDPGGGVDIHASILDDIFLSKFDSSGSFQWARTWGGAYYDEGSGVVADESGNAYVIGDFSGLVDFDPGTGVDNHYFDGTGVFLSKFDPSGNFSWAKTWDANEGHGVALDGSGNIYVTGYYWFTTDFDPGTGDDSHTSNDFSDDIFLSKFDSSGNFQWATTWGGRDQDEGFDVAADSSGNAYVTGYFAGNVDFNPGTASDEHISFEDDDVFLSKFDPNGNW